MSRNVAFYVSGHGYGHATRTAEVVRALIGLKCADNVYVRTNAPTEFFRQLPGVVLSGVRVEFDPGVAEETPLLVSETKTYQALETALACSRRVVIEETQFANNAGIGLLVCDIPFLAGDIAEAVGIPCLAMGNFTWDWIYGSYTARDIRWEGLIDSVRSSYKRMTAWLRLPFHHESDCFRDIVDVPLVARKGGRSRTEVLGALALDAGDTRPRVLLASRGQIGHDVLAEVADSAADFLFLNLGPLPSPVPGNLRSLRLPADVTFMDVLGISDIVVSKLGYSMIADCISCNTAILWPRRFGFREHDLLEEQAVKYLRATELPKEDYDSGNWGPYLRSAIKMSRPSGYMAVDGAEVCAQLIAQRLIWQKG